MANNFFKNIYAVHDQKDVFHDKIVEKWKKQ